jgi:hypothetical protein
MMAVAGGSLEAESTPGRYTRVTLRIPERSWAVGEGARVREGGGTTI